MSVAFDARIISFLTCLKCAAVLRCGWGHQPSPTCPNEMALHKRDRVLGRMRLVAYVPRLVGMNLLLTALTIAPPSRSCPFE
jgi:hypothetical protein